MAYFHHKRNPAARQLKISSSGMKTQLLGSLVMRNTRAGLGLPIE
jgi:hypothetical protein